MRVFSCVFLSLLLLAWSLGTTVVEQIGTPYRMIAEHLDPAAPRGIEYFAQLERALDTHGMLEACPRDLARSVVTIRLARLDAALREGDGGAKLRALTDAQTALNAALRCFPHDGNLWLRMAMVEFVRAGPTESVAQQLAMSAAVFPREGATLKQRIAFAARLAQEEDAAGAATMVLAKDIAVLVGEARPEEIASLYLEAGEVAGKYFEESISTLGSGRQTAIKEAIDRAAAALPARQRF